MPHITFAFSSFACHCARQEDIASRVPDSLHSYVQARCGQSSGGADAPIKPVGAGLDSSRQQQHGNTPDHAAAVAGPSSQQPPSANLQYSVAQRMKAAGKETLLDIKPCQSHLRVSSWQLLMATGIGQAVTVSSKGNWLETLRTKTEKRKMPLSAQQKLQAAHTAAGGDCVVLPGCVLVLLSWSRRQVLLGHAGGGVLKAPARYKFHEGYTNVGPFLVNWWTCVFAQAIDYATCPTRDNLDVELAPSAGCQTPHADERSPQATY